MYEPIFIGPVCIGVGRRTSPFEDTVVVYEILCNTLMDKKEKDASKKSLKRAEVICKALNKLPQSEWFNE